MSVSNSTVISISEIENCLSVPHENLGAVALSLVHLPSITFCWKPVRASRALRPGRPPVKESLQSKPEKSNSPNLENLPVERPSQLKPPFCGPEQMFLLPEGMLKTGALPQLKVAAAGCSRAREASRPAFNATMLERMLGARYVQLNDGLDRDDRTKVVVNERL
jgi:hypothetical protein